MLSTIRITASSPVISSYHRELVHPQPECRRAPPEALHAEVLEFIDNGYSGTNFERPQVQKLIEMVRSNQIDCIIV